MPSSFQPEKPHDPSKHTSGRGAVIVTALVVALLVVMLLALALPVVLQTETLGWTAMIGAGVITFLLVLGVGLYRTTKRSAVDAEEMRAPDERR